MATSLKSKQQRRETNVLEIGPSPQFGPVAQLQSASSPQQWTRRRAVGSNRQVAGWSPAGVSPLYAGTPHTEL
ncbi:MAG: hypothetical protein QOJ64_3398 [Acidobacteriota bacterium]|nr:hypothetical protein [Acidobacteriota bacterium]